MATCTFGGRELPADLSDLRARRGAFFSKPSTEKPSGVGKPKIPVGEPKLLDPGTPWEKNICLLVPDPCLGAHGLVDVILKDCFKMLES